MNKTIFFCECDSIMDIDVGDSIIDGNLRWYKSYKCKKCGNAIEVDGIETKRLPENIRETITNKYGMRGLFLKDSDNLSKIIYIFKKEFEITLNKLNLININIKNQEELIKGTENEMKYIRNVLTKNGINNIEIKKIDM